jgi:predicted phosphodiesterase
VAQKTTGNQPEQIHLTQGASPADMYVSWATGNASYTYCSQSDGATCGNATQACFCNEPKAPLISSQVKYGTDSTLTTYSVGQEAGDYPVTNQYVQYYGPMGTGNNYTSPNLHSIKLTGLKPGTKYYYSVGDGITFSPIKSFKTLPTPGDNVSTKIAITADIGTTHSTYQVLTNFTEGNKPDVVFLAGDHTYADNHNNDQRYWDAWFRLLEPSASAVPWQVSLGNHEEETQWNQCIVNAFNKSGCGNLTEAEIAQNCGSPINSNSTICPCYNSKFSGEKGGINPNFVYNSGCNTIYNQGSSAFVSATARWPVPYAETGSKSNHYYSFEFGLVHTIVLSTYQPICGGGLPCAIYNPGLNVGPSGSSDQYIWLAGDLASVNRTKTPWLVVIFHNPWYTTWGGFKTEDCTRQAMEPLFKQYEVDLVYNGHIHAYERSNPVFNYYTDPAEESCDTVHIVVGDAGNDESLNCGLIDLGLNNGKLNCEGQTVAGNSTEGYYFPCQSHTFQDSPYDCMTNDDRLNTTVFPPSHYGCQEDGYCPNKQPLWSAYRSSAYGSGLLTIHNATSATWKWNGFIRNNANKAGYFDVGPEVLASEEVQFTHCNKPAISAAVPQK